MNSTKKWVAYSLLAIGFTLAGCDNWLAAISRELSVEEDNRELPVEEKTSKAAEEKTSRATVSEHVFDLEEVKRNYGNSPLKILDISERNRDGRNSLAVVLSVPLNPADDHQRYFSISRQGAGAVDGAWVVGESGKIVWFPHIDPNVTYDIRILRGLTAANGQKLAVPEDAEIKTRSLQASINFDTKGLFLTEGLGNGIPVVSVNVEEINIDFFRVEDKKAHDFLRSINTRPSYYRGADYLTHYAKLVHSARYDLDIPKNTRTKRSVPVQDISSLSEPGIYLAVMLPAGQYRREQLLWFSITDVGLHARFYEDQLDVHASSLKTGRALGNVEVSLMNKNTLVRESKTSDDGLASFTGDYSSADLIIAKTDRHYSFIQIERPALDLSEFDLGNRPQLPVELFVYTPRDLFRPGEIIDFNGLLRDGDGRRLPERNPPVLQARIKRPDGTLVKSFRWRSQQKEYYRYSWPIPEAAQTGSWKLEVSGPVLKPTIYTFKVEEFLPERMTLTFNEGDQDPIVSGARENLSIPVVGKYLYGAPAAGNRLSTIINVKHWRSPVDVLKTFQFGDIEAKVPPEFELDDINLDRGGNGTLRIPSKWRSTCSPLEVRMIGSLYETGGRPVTRVYSALVWPAEAMIGIRPDFKDNNPDANSRVAFDIVMADIKGRKLAARDLEVVLIREDRSYFWVYDEGRGWHYEWNDKEYPEFSQTVNIAAGTHAKVEMPVDRGSYRLEVKDNHNRLKSSLRFYAGYNWYADWNDARTGAQAARPDKVTMALDREHYEPGQTAKLQLVPPEAGKALVIVEADNPLWMRRISLPAEGATVEIPIGDWSQHNVYISAIVMRPGTEKESITPKRSFGLIHLPLNRTDRKLMVKFTTPEKILPEETLDAIFQVTQSDGITLPDQIYATVAAVDEGVLSISNFATPDPFEAFFGQRRYSPESRDVYDRVIDISSARNARLRFGGDMDVAKGRKAPPSDVQIVSLFSGLVEVDKEGLGRVPLKIPYFNGRLRLMATAFSDDRFGNGEREITVAAPIVTQISMPRFLAMGDKSTIALDIGNLSGNAQSLQVAVSSDGPVRLKTTSTAIELADEEKTTLTYAIDATEHRGHGQGTIELSIIGADIEPIRRQWKLGVRPPYPAIVKRKQQLLKPGAQYALEHKDIEAMIPETVDAVLSVSSRANLNLRQRLHQLLEYPYGCLEQTSSRVFPLIYANAQQQAQFNLTPIDESKRLQMIEEGIDRIATMQRSNGGFGLWSNRSPENHWLTAFVGDLLLQARDMGVDVPETMLDRVLNRLRQYVNHRGRFVGEHWSEDRDHYAFAYKAYAAYVLSRVNGAPLGSLRTLFDHDFENAKSALPKLHLGLALESMGDKKRAKKAIDSALAHDHREVRRYYYGDYGSRERDLALIIHLLIKHEIRVDEAVKLSFSLADAVYSRERLSTQESNALFFAGSSLENMQADQWRATLTIGDTSATLEEESTFSRRLGSEDISNRLLLQSRHARPLFVSTDISGYSTKAPQVAEHGLSVIRTWYNIYGEEINPSKLKVGELSIVHLEVSAEERTPDALLVDLLPAGLEIENQNLDQAIKLDEFKFGYKPASELIGKTVLKHEEFKDDRYVAALDVSRYNSGHVLYLVRAVTPGEYKVPAPLVEDMYRPERWGIGATLESIIVENTAE